MSSAERLVVREIGGFSLVRELGQGGMGRVFLARQKSLDRLVAVKVLQPSLAEDQEFLARFHREARAAALFQHPNVAAVIDAGKDTANGVHYIAFEFVDGGSLEDRLKKEGRIPEQEALFVVRGIAMALAFAESKGIVHRDVKPDNILLGLDGTPKLADLGLAKQANEEAGHLTQTGIVMGTPLYMAPEQALSEGPLDIRADLYALGLCLWRMLTGRMPFDEDGSASSLAILTRHINEDLPDVRGRAPTVSASTAQIIKWMAAREPQDRYQSAANVSKDLDRALAGEEPLGPYEGVPETVSMESGAPPPPPPRPLRHSSSGRVVASRVPTALPPRSIPIPLVGGVLLGALGIGIGLAVAFTGSPPPAAVSDAVPAVPVEGTVPTAPDVGVDPAADEAYRAAFRARVDALWGKVLVDLPEAHAHLEGLDRDFDAKRFGEAEAAALKRYLVLAGAGIGMLATDEEASRDHFLKVLRRLVKGVKAVEETPENARLRELATQIEALVNFSDEFRKLLLTPRGERDVRLRTLISSAGSVFGPDQIEAAQALANIPSKPDRLRKLTKLCLQRNSIAAAGGIYHTSAIIDSWSELPPSAREQSLTDFTIYLPALEKTAFGRAIHQELRDITILARALLDGGSSATETGALIEARLKVGESRYIDARLREVELKTDFTRVDGRGLVLVFKGGVGEKGAKVYLGGDRCAVAITGDTLRIGEKQYEVTWPREPIVQIEPQGSLVRVSVWNRETGSHVDVQPQAGVELGMDTTFAIKGWAKDPPEVFVVRRMVGENAQADGDGRASEDGGEREGWLRGRRRRGRTLRRPLRGQ